ncbi:MAG: hypothetical protein WBO71_16930 [Thermoanaerobaculia bacterium]
MTRLTVSTMLAVLGVVSATGLSGQESAVGGEVPEAIGFVEIDGVGRYDIYPIAEGMTRSEASGLIYGSNTPTAFWHGYDDNTGGKVYIYALPASGDPTESTVLAEFYLLEGRTGLDTIRGRGIHLNPPISGQYEWDQLFGTEVTVEEFSVDGNGPMTLKLRFEGAATRTYSSGSPPPSEVPMKGVLEVTGLPYRPF